MKCQFSEKQSDKVNSCLNAEAFDSEGIKIAELSGSWLNEINMKWVYSGNTENLWVAGSLVENPYMNYYFSPRTVLMNYKSPEMEGYVCHRDSRYRHDLRCYEDGEID